MVLTAGHLGGTPTAAGTCTFTIKVTDSAGDQATEPAARRRPTGSGQMAPLVTVKVPTAMPNEVDDEPLDPPDAAVGGMDVLAAAHGGLFARNLAAPLRVWSVSLNHLRFGHCRSMRGT